MIVSDPSQPPVQSNIKTVVEMKFPPDRINRTQELAYIDIAGGDVSKFVTLGPADCGCPDPKKESKTSSAKQAAPQTGLDDLYGGSGSGMGVPSMVPMPLPPIPVIP